MAATAIAAFVQLRHLSTTNQLAALNNFREEFERLQEAARAVYPTIAEHLRSPQTRREIGLQAPEWVAPLMPLMRLFETLGSYTTHGIVSKDLVCDLWSPVIVLWWDKCAPLIAVMRRTGGMMLYENWEAIAVLSRRWLDQNRQSYRKRLPRIGLVDPWAQEDASAENEMRHTTVESPPHRA